jgi:hypothetical protein
MLDRDLSLADGASEGAWIKPRLGGEFGAVTLHVPKGFEAYARVFHQAISRECGPVTWEEVAKACGTTAHREMQWHAILGFADADELQGSYAPDDPGGPRWGGWDPPIGQMDLNTLDALCAILAGHTADPERCLFGLSTIKGWEDDFTREKLDNTRLLGLPMERDYVVLGGPLSAIDQIVRDLSKPSPSRATFVLSTGEGPAPEPDPSWLRQREAPNLIWPVDHSWLVASEVDFDSTLVGGSAALIEAIAGSPDLEAWQVEPTDSLADDADKVNVVSESND